MISNYNNYDDLKEQFIYDILAILEDLVYHISIFNIYFISALRFLGKRDKMDSGIIQDGFANYLKTVDVDNISYTWKIDISKERKRQLSFIYVSWCFFICELCNRIKSNHQEVFDLLDQLHTFAVAIILLYKDMNNHRYNTSSLYFP